MAGVVQSFAYVFTGNIWFASGLHSGANSAAFSISGLWHAGAVVALTGRPTIPYWAPGVIMLAVFSAVFVLQRRHREKVGARHAVPEQLVG